jgi:rhodanese-related sulfurtransferase
MRVRPCNRPITYLVATVVALAAPAILPLAAQGRPDAGTLMSPAEAHRKALAGEIVFVDVRTPEEWRETGVPASALPITMHQDAPKLLAALAQATGGDKSKALALICRTGNRTSFLQAELKKAGYTQVINVAEGVVGGPFGKGWLKTGLPVKRP